LGGYGSTMTAAQAAGEIAMAWPGSRPAGGTVDEGMAARPERIARTTLQESEMADGRNGGGAITAGHVAW
jgi:hypothetical protein